MGEVDGGWKPFLASLYASRPPTLSFSKRFLYYLSTFWSLIAAVYFFLATFTPVNNDKIADIILGFLMGGVVGVMLNFFYGDSHKVK